MNAEPAEVPSKSQRKRDSKALQALAEELAKLSPHQREKLPLTEELGEALALAGELERSAFRRQIRYLGRLLRDADVESLRAGLDRLRLSGREATAELHRIERWRDRLIDEGDAALEALVARFPAVDRQRVRQLARSARRERESGKRTGDGRALFRFLRDLGDW